MKELFIGWIIFQLVCIGMMSIQVHNEITEETLDCSTSVFTIREGKAPLWVGTLFPLLFFVPESKESIDYCKKQLEG